MAARDNIHATAVAIDGMGVLLTGQSGSGKSDLALRLIDRGAKLVADDRVDLASDGKQIAMSAPPNIAGKMEIRGIGILEFDHITANLAMVAELTDTPPRMPIQQNFHDYFGLRIPMFQIAPFEHSAVIKVELALRELSVQDGPHG